MKLNFGISNLLQDIDEALLLRREPGRKRATYEITVEEPPFLPDLSKVHMALSREVLEEACRSEDDFEKVANLLGASILNECLNKADYTK